MPVIATATLVDRARAAGVGVAAFNVITLEHAEGLVAAAERAGSPIIMQISQNAVRFRGSLHPLAAATLAIAAASPVAVAVHLDHVDDLTLLHQAPVAGLSSAMFDAGNLHYADNVSRTRAAADWAHQNGLWLEAELGYVGGKADAPASAHAPGARTDPAEAADYVGATGVDALAVAVGTSHAMTTRSARLDIDLVTRLRDAVPVPLVLHGSSGVANDQLRDGIRAGLTKINVGTALNIGYTQAVRSCLAADADVSDPRKYLGPARQAVVDVAADLIATISGRRDQ
ncbi:MAG: class II fructose-bisphosphate aldolase [Jatrophihabitans sp.]|uniref:class II fructose-bisphosphate aldolase n=1 Tax=Jatrophihabitans sp. TaxID=1932789 RepID=UPI00391501B8